MFYEINFLLDDGMHHVGGYNSLEDAVEVARLYVKRSLSVTITDFRNSDHPTTYSLEEAEKELKIRNDLANKSQKFERKLKGGDKHGKK